MNVLIGGAWPYANGSLHLGHIAGLLPGDILARYYRLKGDQVLYVSGSDCHGTPIALRAKQEGVNPSDIADKYHNEFSNCFEKLGFTYDNYTRTDNPNHHRVVQDMFKQLLEKGYIYEKTIEQTYCESCGQFLPDRYVEGICPHCGNTARGDQCDYCSSLLNPSELIDRKCKICGSTPAYRDTKHLFFALSKFQNELATYVNNSKGWRENAVNLTKRYLDEGLQDRAATRDLSWGIDVPVPEYDGKKIYVWIEAVLGYLSASIEWSQKTGGDYKSFWEDEDTVAYYVHGKDNIPFHTLILPGLLLGIGDKKLPDKIISSEYLTIEGKKLSTSRNWAIWVPYIVQKYNPDALRYFLTINGPEKRDADFSWREFVNSNNGELLGAFGNFVNRTLVFAQKYFDGKVPGGKNDIEITKTLKSLYTDAGNKIEAGDFKEALENIFTFIRGANKYFDKEQPWVTVKDNKDKCQDTIYNCIVIIANLSDLLSPFIPFACEKIRGFLDIKRSSWKYIEPEKGESINQSEILFERLDKSIIDVEIKKLGQNS